MRWVFGSGLQSLRQAQGLLVAALITPPVCPTSYIAAGIAGANPMQTGMTAARLAIVAFIVPFLFIFRPALLTVGSAGAIIFAALTTFVATAGLAVRLAGYLAGPLGLLWRGLLVVALLLCISPDPGMGGLGMAVIAAGVLYRIVALRVARAGERAVDPRPVVSGGKE